MKKILIIFLLFFKTPFAFSQTTSDSIYTIVDTLAEYPTGVSGLLQEVLSKVKLTTEIVDAGVFSSIHIQFIVDEDGTYHDFMPYKTRNRPILIHCAIIEVLEKMPKWKPAIKNGIKVKSNL